MGGHGRQRKHDIVALHATKRHAVLAGKRIMMPARMVVGEQHHHAGLAIVGLADGDDIARLHVRARPTDPVNAQAVRRIVVEQHAVAALNDYLPMIARNDARSGLQHDRVAVRCPERVHEPGLIEHPVEQDLFPFDHAKPELGAGVTQDLPLHLAIEKLRSLFPSSYLRIMMTRHHAPTFTSETVPFTKSHATHAPLDEDIYIVPSAIPAEALATTC